MVVDLKLELSCVFRRLLVVRCCVIGWCDGRGNGDGARQRILKWSGCGQLHL